MKHIVLALVAILATATLSCATENMDSEKDWCLLGISSKCAGSTTLDRVEKAKRLETALNEKAALYTPEELKHLRAMLEEVKVMDELLDVRR